MSLLGQSRRFWPRAAISALPLIATIKADMLHFRFVPNGDICAATNCNLLDHLIGEVVGEENVDAEGAPGAASKKGCLKPCMGQTLRGYVRPGPRSRVIPTPGD
jgi:hypothetical protein